MTENIDEIIEGIVSCSASFRQLCVTNKNHSVADIIRLVDCLCANPDFVIRLWLRNFRLPEEVGIKIALYLSRTSVLRLLDVSGNQFGESTYAAIASALYHNSSLQVLQLQRNRAVKRDIIDHIFVSALWLNTDRAPDSEWCLYGSLNHYDNNDFIRYRALVRHLGRPPTVAYLACAYQHCFES